MKEQLLKLRTGLRMISGTPSQQTLRDLSQKAAEDYLSGVISQEAFRQVLTENEFLRLQGEAFAMARPKIQAQERALDEIVSTQRIADERAAYLASEPERIAQRETERVAKTEAWQAEQRN